MNQESKPNTPYTYLSNLAQKCSMEPLTTDLVADFPPSEDPVYILGNKYSSLYELDDIRQDVRTKLWMTYRRGFPSISESNFTSDRGWGCMLRCGQMVLAQALIHYHLGRKWRWNYEDHDSIRKLLMSDVSQKDELQRYLLYRKILGLFADLKTAPYSIHQIALMGVCEGKNVGQWFGPNTVAQVLKKLSPYDTMNNLKIYVALDNVIFIEDINKLCKPAQQSDGCQNVEQSSSQEEWKPLLIIIPLRLGLTDINPIYFRALKTTFSFPQTLGILGGRPNHALYFIGCSGDDLVYLDPHTTQQAVLNLATTVDELKQMLERTEKFVEKLDITETNCENIVSMTDDVSYHCEYANRMPITMLDPSLALCFLCKTEEEFNQWANLAKAKLVTSAVAGGSDEQPLFEILLTKPKEWRILDDEDDDDDCAKNYNFHHRKNSSSDNQDEEYENNDSEFEIID